ncbi:MAG: 5-(carboxyamino)imidazole ribonucleotide synthase [Sphingomicrobium sp.]
MIAAAQIIGPGSTIGIIGGGQLGRMLATAAAELGYDCHVFAPDADPPAARVAARSTRADYDDVAALREFAAAVDVATYEFENLPASALAELGDKIRPGTASLAIAQDRAAEKRFIEAHGGTVARWLAIDSDADAAAAEATLGLPLVFKSRRLGYDGKGQAWAREPGSAIAAWASIGREPAVAEAAVDFAAEFSVILARSASGETVAWDLPLNHHVGGILCRSTVPAGDPVGGLAEQAVAVASGLAQALDHVGVLTVEFFALDPARGAPGPIVNEIAPRVHNSGHWTSDGAVTSQFEQHVRAICGLPLGSTRRLARSVTMDNLIGDQMLAWPHLLADPDARLHLYGKGAPRPGRKMGHVTRLAE